MATWEFLLQQEGDGEWLPLESPVVEILEGRYRLVAYSRYPNTPTWVDVAFRDEYYEFSPVNSVHSYVEQTERMQSWESQTNTEGLLLLLPFSYLKPGQWEFKCQVEADSQHPDHLSQVVSSQICLQVSATESNVKDPWSNLDLFSTGALVPDHAASNPTTTPISVPSPTLTLANTPTSRPTPVSTSTVLAEPCLSTILADTPLATASFLADPGLAAHNFRYYFNIVQEHLAVHRRGESVWLLGEIQIEAPTDVAASALPFPILLQVILREPQNRQPIQEFFHPLGNDLIPIPFACELPIPADYQPHLLLGELTLCRINPAKGEHIALASQPFSVATNLDAVFAEPRSSNETIMTRLFNAIDLHPTKTTLNLDERDQKAPKAFPLFPSEVPAIQEKSPMITEMDQNFLDSFEDDIQALELMCEGLSDLDTFEEFETQPVVSSLEAMFLETSISPNRQDTGLTQPSKPHLTPWTGKLCLDLFNLVKHPSNVSPLPAQSFAAQTEWENPPQLIHQGNNSETLPDQAVQNSNPTLTPSQFPDLPLRTGNKSQTPVAWSGTLQSPVFDGYASVREFSERPVSSAQVLTRLIHATQADVPAPTLNQNGGRAAIQNRFHSKLADLLSVQSPQQRDLP